MFRACGVCLAFCAALLAGPSGPCGAQEKESKAPTAQSPDNRLTATGTDKAITVFDGQAQRELLRLMGHTDRVTALAFSPDGKLLASGSADRSIGVWDVATGRLLLRLKVPAAVTGVAFSPDGRTLTTREADRTVRVWDIPTGKQLKQFKEKEKK
jgi:WD40 repeat protein